MSRVKEIVNSTPATTLCATCFMVSLHVVSLLTTYPITSRAALSAFSVWGSLELWRLVTSFLVHGSVLHLLTNMYSFYVLGATMEKQIGSVAFAILIFQLGILSSSLYVAVSVALSRFAHVHVGAAVGFSGVLFALLSIRGFLSGPVFGGALGGTRARYLEPWLLLIATQVVMPRVSFLGHLSGIVVGTLYGCGAMDVCLPRPSFVRERFEGSACCLERLGGFAPCTSSDRYLPTNSESGQVLGDGSSRESLCERYVSPLFKRRTDKWFSGSGNTLSVAELAPEVRPLKAQAPSGVDAV